jgi:hypothetical protein
MVRSPVELERVLRANDARRAEGHLGIGLDIEEIGRAQVPVPLLGARVDARRLERDLDARVTDALLVGDDRPLELGEPAADGRDHHVLRHELDRRVARVELPGGAGARRAIVAVMVVSRCKMVK